MNTATPSQHRMSFSLWRCVATCAILAATLIGCTQQTPPATPRQFHRGWLWVFPGIEGGSWSVTDVKRALVDAGVTSAISTYNWERPVGGLTNLMLYEGNRERAALLAQDIVRYRRSHPTQPIDLIGYSGGGGIAIMVAEALPVDVKVNRIILVQAAISPDYDLCPALLQVSDRIINVYCPSDWLFLGGGTLVFGTMDRKFTVSAGKVGFNVEQAVRNTTLQSRLHQIPWTPEMMRSGHIGTHLGIMGYQWNRQYVAPLLIRSHTSAASPTRAEKTSATTKPVARRTKPSATTQRPGTTTAPTARSSSPPNIAHTVPVQSDHPTQRTAANLTGARDAHRSSSPKATANSDADNASSATRKR